jgi:hypothetical protein
MSNRITLDAPIAKVAKLTLAGFLIIFVLGAAKDHAPPNALSQSQIRSMLIGNTISSQPGNSVDFTEFHAQGGQVYGSNDGIKNDRFCWQLVANQICYTLPGEYICYWVVKNRSEMELYMGPGLSHHVRILPKDPLKLNDQPRYWACPTPSE